METTFKEIAKEQVGSLRFPHEDVLDDPQARQQRRKALEQALLLGNLERIKLKIIFEDDQAARFVHTTIWGLTDEAVILKRGDTIPLHRIRAVL
jgi:hypothetical protein